MHVVFYTKIGCSLCDDAERMMELVQEDYPLSWTRVNILEDDVAHEKYMLMIPVIEKDRHVLLSGNIGYVDIIELFVK
ncbi:glutaredoxin family protein [Sporosarcina sp. FA9]|uniref:glutaredoxin family protein n=1 Tax=Sporosarcina sp. FA9 TaxID=3413030 RepID=UPI003F660AC8